MQTFKVGDWIKEPNNTLTKLKEIPEPNSYYAEECVLWQPLPGDGLHRRALQHRGRG